jgi:hypothetical protein
MVFNRFMRLTPSIAIVVLLNQSLGLFFHNRGAPSGFLDYSFFKCQKYWWAALLNVQVYTNPSEMVNVP